MSDSVRPHDGSPSGSTDPGIFQARTLDRVAISFSNAWKWKVKVKSLSHVRLLVKWMTARIHRTRRRSGMIVILQYSDYLWSGTGIIWKWIWISCKCILHALAQPIKKFKKRSIINMLRKKRIWNYIKYSAYITKGRRRVEDKNRTKEQSQWIEWSRSVVSDSLRPRGL